MTIAFFIGSFTAVPGTSPYQESDKAEELIYGDITETGEMFTKGTEHIEILKLIKEVVSLPNVIYTTSLSMREGVYDEPLVTLSMRKGIKGYAAHTIDRLQAIITQSKAHPDTVLITNHIGRGDFVVCRLPAKELEDIGLTAMTRRLIIDNFLKDLEE